MTSERTHIIRVVAALAGLFFVVAVVPYPNWSDARTFCIFVGWRVARPLLILASSTRLIPSCCKLSANGRIRALEASTVCGAGVMTRPLPLRIGDL